jgi:hypothetical protein
MKPVEYDLGGTTGVYHQYVQTDKLTSRSKFGKILTAFVSVFGPKYVEKVGAGQLNGAVAWFKEYVVKGGRNQDDWTYYAPFKMATEEEIGRAKAKMSNSATPVGVSGNVSTFSEEQIDAIIRVALGQSEETVQIAAAKSKLPPELKAPILAGTAIDSLVNQGRLALDESGKYIVPATDQPEF